MKTYSRCGEERNIQDFAHDSSRPSGYYPTCKICMQKSANTKTGKARKRNWNLFKLYGISLAGYRKMYEERGGKCDVCNTKVDLLHIDHSHKTGVIRGLLCVDCNTGIGCFKDSVLNMQIAIRYIRRNDRQPNLEEMLHHLART